MRYSDLDLDVSITLGSHAMAALTQKNELLFVQNYNDEHPTVINLGVCTKKRLNVLKEHLDRLSIHMAAD